ncbi:MAG: hypothetical protein JWP95_1373 [Actinotalea sp.]|nr:hypothetical protein [Actinotalea sp.]
MSTNLTQENDSSVATFLDEVADPVRRADAWTLVELMTRATGQPARMWGTAIVGFGRYHYVYATGREGDAPAAGFSPRKAASTIYLGDLDQHADLLARLGPHTTSVSCLYVKRLGAVDLDVLEELVRRSYTATTARTWPSS